MLIQEPQTEHIFLTGSEELLTGSEEFLIGLANLQYSSGAGCIKGVQLKRWISQKFKTAFYIARTNKVNILTGEEQSYAKLSIYYLQWRSQLKIVGPAPSAEGAKIVGVSWGTLPRENF